MKVLHVVPSYFPNTFWGGPIFSTKAICDGLSTTPGVEVRILTTDSAGPSVAENMPAKDAPDLGYQVRYTRRLAGHSIAPGLVARLPAAVAWADVVHVSATYSFPVLPAFLTARVLGKPVVWSPRGAIQATYEWKSSPNQRLKRGFERICNWALPQNAALHVTSKAEAHLTKGAIPRAHPCEIRNAVALPETFRQPREKKADIRLMFLSRVHPKKGVLDLIRAMEHLPAQFTLDIYGSGEQRHLQEAVRAARPFKNRIRFHGHVSGAEKERAFAQADLFVLPTYSENFGIAIAEALAAAVPVLTTHAAPWSSMRAQRCGRSIAPGSTKLAAEIAAMTQEDLNTMGANGRAWMARDFGPEAMLTQFLDLYRSLLPSGPDAERFHAA